MLNKIKNDNLSANEDRWLMRENLNKKLNDEYNCKLLQQHSKPSR